MSRTRLLFVLVVVMALIAPACGGRDDEAQDTPDATRGSGPTESSSATEATEIGITETEIHVAAVMDVDNAVLPGISQPLLSAVQAWADNVNADGGLAGRQVVVDFYDSKLNPDEATNAFTQACQNSFASVGSAAFVLLNPAPIVDCPDRDGAATGLPDIAALAVSQGAGLSTTTYELIGAGQDYTAATPTYDIAGYGFDYFADQLGSATPKVLSIEPGTPGQHAGAEAVQDVFAELGYEAAGVVTFADDSPQTEATPIVNQIRSEGINWVQATSEGIAKVKAEAEVQGLDTASIVWTCTSQCHQPRFIEQYGDAAEGFYVAQLMTPFTDTDVDGIAEYLASVDPDEVSANGVAAYASGLAFQELVEKIVDEDGVNGLTRARLLQELEAGTPVTARGILAEGTALGEHSTCWVVNQVQDGQWTRVDPADEGEFTCDDNVVTSVSGDYR